MTPNSSDMLDQAQAASYLGVGNPRTLAAWRLRRCGPAYCRVGALIRYHRHDLEAWLAARRVTAGA